MTSTEQVKPDLLGRMFNAEWLMAQTFPPVEYVVPGLFPEGLTLLAAAPKIGKSWLVLGVAVAASEGGYALGQVPVDQRPVLYLALEDGQRRLQDRLRSLEVTYPSPGLHFITTVDNGAMIATIRQFVETYAADKPLVVLDTLGKVMPPALPNETTYQRDYRATGALKAIVDRHPGSSLLCVHHTRKAEAGDFLDAVSGTQGVAGAADTIAVLTRSREDSSAVLRVTSRDAREGSYALTMSERGAWTLDGTDLEQAAQTARTSAVTIGLGDRMAELVAYVNTNQHGVRADEVAAALHMSKDDAGRYLRRAVDSGRLERASRGLYTPVRSVRSVRSGEVIELFPATSDTPDTTDTPPTGHHDEE